MPPLLLFSVLISWIKYKIIRGGPLHHYPATPWGKICFKEILILGANSCDIGFSNHVPHKHTRSNAPEMSLRYPPTLQFMHTARIQDITSIVTRCLELRPVEKPYWFSPNAVDCKRGVNLTLITFSTIFDRMLVRWTPL